MRRLPALLIAGLFAASLAAPGVVMGAPPWGGNVHVVTPTGTDDTTNLQNALNLCSGPRGCTVQLLPGTYHTRQVVANNLKGSLRGAGEDRTTIEALPNLPVAGGNATDPFECSPNLDTCPWPVLITFVNGTIEVSDLSIHEGANNGTATAPWTFGPGSGFGTLTALWEALFFTGQHTDVSVDRVAIKGEHDITSGSAYGYDLACGVAFVGTPETNPPLTGSLAVRDSSFKTTSCGLSIAGILASDRLTVGGSPWAGNRFDDVDVGLDLETAQSSVFDVSYNVVTQALWNDLWVVPWNPDIFVPSSPSQYLIHDNTFVTSVTAANVFLFGGFVTPWIEARIWDNTVTPGGLYGVGIDVVDTAGSVISNNTIRLQAPGADGIDVIDTAGSVISGNAISGGTSDPGSGEETAIGLWSATGSKVIGNDVSRVTPDTPDNGGLAQIYLGAASGGPPSSGNLVVCVRHRDTVLDLGTGDKIVGCTPAPAPVVAQVAPAGRPAPLRSIPKPNPYFP